MKNIFKTKDNKLNKVNEKDFELFDSDKKKYVSTNRKRSGVRINDDNFNDGKIIKGDFESRRRNKLNEVVDKDNFETYDWKQANDNKKLSNNVTNFINFNSGKKENGNYLFHKY